MAINNIDQYRDHPLLAQNPDLVRVLQVFSGITNHPRASKQEEAIRAHLIDVATEQGWKVDQDEAGNVAFQVPATPGLENVMPVVMQGHMDQVTFPTDAHLPRHAEIVDKGEEGDEKGLWVQTIGQETTLGADNGMGVALAVATMMDPTLEHGPVTILVTVDEETGMSGAKELDPRLIPETGILLNLDSEEGSVNICIGCAGNADTVASFPIGEREALPEEYTRMDLELKGFPGGHSGVQIHLGLGSSIKSMGELLSRLQEAAGDLKILKIDGGEKRNSVPSKASATIAIPTDSVAALEEVIRSYIEELKKGKEVEDPSVTGELLAKNAQKIDITLIQTESVELVGALSSDLKSRLLGVIAEIPTGPFSSAELPNVGKLVTLSNNLGVLATNQDDVTVASMTRGARVEETRAKLAEIRAMYLAHGATLKQAEEPTAGWLEDPTNSEAVAIVTEAVQKAAGDAKWMAYHAGLESGIVAGKARGSMSAVSIGPLIVDAHTPRERVHLPSVVDELVALREIFAQVVKKAA
ncbi:MAG: M20/M25/M40 family metallo-hydrolase [Candidatus Peregrinibacteria bacterium]|nr:M20/M25/M40 family metallo-hydrolase [Candidatus Peregrinibacteria bacterium]